jgi:hypothetical protein
MKRFGLLSVVFVLLLLNANVLAQEMVYEGQRTAHIDMQDASRQGQFHPTVTNVLWMSEKFGVSPSWIHNELTKGYILTDI